MPRDPSFHRTLAVMSRDAAILAEIDTAFGDAERPEHFTDHAHCDECAEHDALLRARDRDSLRQEDVGNPGWDPICFCSASGIAYYFPALARLALAEPTPTRGWYADQLLFHLYYGFTENRFFQYCSVAQRLVVSRLIGHMIESRAAVIDSYAAADEFLRCHELWRDARPVDAGAAPPVGGGPPHFKP